MFQNQKKKRKKKKKNYGYRATDVVIVANA
jgi:hypothetical protein